MKKTWILTAGLLAALSLAADTELDINGTLKATKADAKFPDTWIYYPQYTQVDITSEIVRSEKGNQWKLNISDAKKKGMHLPYFCPKLFPVKPGEKYKFTASVQGNAKIQMALYVNDARGIAGNLLAKPVILTGKPEEISAEFTIPAETPRKTPPVSIRFVMNIYKGDVVFSGWSAIKLDGSGVLKKVEERKPQDRLTDAMDSMDGWKVFRGKAEVVDADGGKAIRMDYPGVRMTKTFSYEISDAPFLKDMQGISFEAKGEADRTIWLPVQIGSYGNWSWNYEKYVPITGDKFQTYTIAWSDFIQPRATRGMEFGKPGALMPEGVNLVTFGDTWTAGNGNQKFKPGKVAIRNLRFAPKAEAKVPSGCKGFGKLADVIAKMKSGKDVLIYCSGDSLTANGPENARYAEVLEKNLQKQYNNPNIRTKIIAVGGAHSYNLRVWAERDFTNRPTPDLVTLTVGYNDRSAAMDKDIFKASISDYMDRISALTNGKAAILLMPTMPARAERYYMQDPLADAFRELAKERDFALFDLHNIFKAMKPAEYNEQFSDKCHFNETGHARIAKEIADYLKKQ